LVSGHCCSSFTEHQGLSLLTVEPGSYRQPRRSRVVNHARTCFQAKQKEDGALGLFLAPSTTNTRNSSVSDSPVEEDGFEPCGSGFQGNVSSIPLPSYKLAVRHSRF
jgi:hypothetical protein